MRQGTIIKGHNFKAITGQFKRSNIWDLYTQNNIYVKKYLYG